MRDINSREDILLIMRRFYTKLLEDNTINFFFTEVTEVEQHLEEHFEILATFWEQSLFLKGGYHNNMFAIHKNIHEKRPFTKKHFDIWLNHFNNAIDLYCLGETAEQMKTQALNMATVMQIKFSNSSL